VRKYGCAKNGAKGFDRSKKRFPTRCCFTTDQPVGRGSCWLKATARLDVKVISQTQYRYTNVVIVGSRRHTPETPLFIGRKMFLASHSPEVGGRVYMSHKGWAQPMESHWVPE
jgi:hypothetical protein